MSPVRRRPRRILDALAACLLTTALLGEPLVKIWDTNLSSIVKETLPLLGQAGHEVVELLFSEDEELIVISMGSHFAEENTQQNHVLILRRDRPAEPPIQYDYLGDAAKRVVIAPDKQFLAIQQTLTTMVASSVRAESFQIKRSPGAELGGFMDDRVVIGGPDEWQSFHPVRSRLWFYDTACNVIKSLPVIDEIFSVDTSRNPERILLAIHGEDRVVDSKTKSVTVTAVRDSTLALAYPSMTLAGRSDGLVYGRIRLPPARFIDGGGAFCAPGRIDSSGALPQCRKIGGGLLDKTPRLRSGRPISTATQGHLVAAADVGFSYNTFTEQGRRDYRGIVIYDYETGKQVARLPVSLQHVRTSSLDLKSGATRPFVFALSPSGRYLVEGGENSLRLYELLPERATGTTPPAK